MLPLVTGGGKTTFLSSLMTPVRYSLTMSRKRTWQLTTSDRSLALPENGRFLDPRAPLHRERDP